MLSYIAKAITGGTLAAVLLAFLQPLLDLLSSQTVEFTWRNVTAAVIGGLITGLGVYLKANGEDPNQPKSVPPAV